MQTTSKFVTLHKATFMARYIILLFVLFFVFVAKAQQNQNHQHETPSPYYAYGKGLGITSPDSLFMLNIRFRIQNRFAFTTDDVDDFDIDEIEARVRRMRLRFDGFIYDPRLTYIIQLSFSRADMDFDDTGFPNILRDAMIQYQVSKKFIVAIGQGKLPGNRQRVVSSGDLQLADRSIVNSTFNIDRDFGLQMFYREKYFVLRGAMSSGEGRNVTKSDQGLAYTARVELLPFGQFTNGGDYFEGDLMREPKPKVSLGLTFSDNENTLRTGGQLGKPLFEARDIITQMADFLLKYKGFALSAEYFYRKTNENPITTDAETGDTRFVYQGKGLNAQASYLLTSNYEFVGRYSTVRPANSIANLTDNIDQYTLGLSKYIKGHRVKLQTDVTLENRFWQFANNPSSKNWQVRFQVEMGI
jgi:phosphate-selective porin OprO/OprP